MLHFPPFTFFFPDKGTFYIDDSYSFSRVLLLGNHVHIFVLELLLLLSLFLITSNLLIAAAAACVFNMVGSKCLVPQCKDLR